LAIKQSDKKGLIPVIRPNGTSDIPFEKYPCVRDGIEYANIFFAFSEIQFYDYTKILGRKVNHIPNYHLTFSRSETALNHLQASMALAKGHNIAAVFSTKKGFDLPSHYEGKEVIDGDKHDLRFLDLKGCVVGLRAKGPARQDNSGFVIRL
jgi:hypothetical protein